MHWLCLGKPDWDTYPERIEDASRHKPIGIAPHGALGERLHRQDKLDTLTDLLKRIRDTGVLVGLSAHNPALIELAGDGVPFTVVIAGDGPLLPAVLARLDQAGLTPRVRALGEVSRRLLGDVLCASDVLCLPSRWEGISLVVQEAMARGAAVVTADVGGQRELVAADCAAAISVSRVPVGSGSGL